MDPRTGPAHRPRRMQALDRPGELEAVADIVGSVLLVGITVATAVAFGGVLLSFDGPDDVLHARLELRLDPGADGWGTGDERLEVVHLGGEGVPMEGTRIVWSALGATQESTGAALGPVFADGTFTIGEVWQGPFQTLSADTEVDVLVAAGTDRSQILAAGAVAGGEAR